MWKWDFLYCKYSGHLGHLTRERTALKRSLHLCLAFSVANNSLWFSSSGCTSLRSSSRSVSFWKCRLERGVDASEYTITRDLIVISFSAHSLQTGSCETGSTFAHQTCTYPSQVLHAVPVPMGLFSTHEGSTHRVEFHSPASEWSGSLGALLKSSTSAHGLINRSEFQENTSSSPSSRFGEEGASLCVPRTPSSSTLPEISIFLRPIVIPWSSFSATSSALRQGSSDLSAPVPQAGGFPQNCTIKLDCLLIGYNIKHITYKKFSQKRTKVWENYMLWPSAKDRIHCAMTENVEDPKKEVSVRYHTFTKKHLQYSLRFSLVGMQFF